MAQLIYEIGGNSAGLNKAANEAIAIIQRLDTAISNLGGSNLGGGSSLSSVVSGLNGVKKASDQVNLSLKDKSGLAALDALGAKLLVIKGNAELFGDSVKSQQNELNAYQTALNKLLSAGFDPLDGDITRIKANIDGLTASIQAQNQALAIPVKRTIISDSLSEATAFNNSQSGGGGAVASSGKSALIAEFNKDLVAGKITAAQYKAEIDAINASQAKLAATTGATAGQMAKELGVIEDLKIELASLNKQKLTADFDQLPIINRKIQDVESNIVQFGNIGKRGFDDAGNAIKGFGKEAEQTAQGGLAGVGRGLTSAFGSLRQLAYILPGIGIAGIFNLAFIGIAKAAEALDLFNSKISVSEANLNNLNEVTKNASKQFGEQSTNLRILYQATQDVALSERDRLLAAQELQKEFPALFGNIKAETILNGGAADAYNLATTAILENAKAKAAATKISQLAGLQLENEFKLIKISNALSNENARVKPITQGAQGFGFNDAAPVQFNAKQQAESIIAQKAANADRAKLSAEEVKQNTKDLQAQIDFLTKFAGGNNKIAQALTEGQKIKTGSGENIFATLSKQLDEILAKSAHLADQSGLTGYALEVQKINDKYKDLNRSIDEVISKAGLDAKGGKISQSQLGTLNSKAKSDKSQLAADQAKELSDLQIKEAKRVSDEIQRINDEFGIKSEQSREKEIQQIQARYDAEVKKAEGNKEILTTLDTDRAAAIQAINDKYLLQQQDLQDKIAAINQQANADIAGITESATGRIVKEWESRRQAADRYYQQLQLIIASELKGADALAGFNVSGLVGNAIKGQQSQTNTNITNAENTDVNREILKPFTQGITEATRGIVQFFSTFNQQTDQSFKALFTGLVSQVENVFNRIFEGILDKELQNSLINGVSGAASSAQKSLTGTLQKGTADGTKHLSSQLSAGLTTALAGVGLLGSAISGLTPKTSVAGQGAGGLLQGAASGALIGSVIPGVGTVAGAIIGGGIGLLSGIFGASKAQKELQAQQLEQQKEQLAATKASLAYTSSIIGRMTAQGLITGVDVSSSGQLVARVSGRDLQFILDRNGNGR